MNLVLDAGTLIVIDRDDRRVAGFVELGRRAGASLVTAAPIVAQASRNGTRQAGLALPAPRAPARQTGTTTTTTESGRFQRSD